MRAWLKKATLRAMRSIVSLHGTPRNIALGTAIGVFIAFTPTIGFQMLLGAFVATLVGANRPASMIPAWLTNPVTIPPVFAGTYWLGRFFWSGPPVREVYQKLLGAVEGLARFNWYEFHLHFNEFLLIGLDAWVSMLIGGVIVGAVLGVLSYPLTLWAVNAYRHQVEALKHRIEVHREKYHHAERESSGDSPPQDGDRKV